ncbi:nucleoside hydrolase [Dactylosporangium sp. NBC_01737]|uniref:nucleoside hydrolase n=1 Tax=Dactylosporangium sp. NBC_01737 TaxID=2975959 RepID=UPI002E0FBD38|nr:nucleoside hydrolase [Dactylosporangium sp. NBC_01737]
MELIWDMETSDPDDFVTLLLLLGHPRVDLIGVTVTPGTPDQVGVVRRALDWFGRSIPVGAFNLAHQVRDQGQGHHGRRGACVSSWHYAAFGDMPPSTDAASGPELLRDLCGPATTLVTGAPLKNLGAALRLPGFQLGEVVVQGGFAGAGVVPEDRQLEKFRGLVTCPSYNLNGDPRSALAVIAAESIARKRFVSKNVCHGVVYDRALHAEVAAVRHRATSLDLIWQGMDVYLNGPDAPAGHHRESADPRGKMLHDPLAACCAIDPSIAEWAEVDLYRERGAWGSRPAPGSGVHITVAHDHQKFLATLLAS